MRKRALVLDDDPVMRRTLGLLLGLRGYDVIPFPNPTACPINLTHVPLGVFADVIFSDLEMPGMKGLEFVEDILGKGLQCPAIALVSGVWTDERRQRAEQLGCKVLTKPLQTDALNAWLDQVEREIRPTRVLADWDTLPLARA
jgi:CheY-like chemotaxis protein